MGLRLESSWVWDFWLAQDAGLWHVFFLHAPRTPDDPDRRHFSARIGHATSTDLTFWELQPEALAPGPPGAWDDIATWTGSVVPGPEGGWAMLYTGVGSREEGLVQRIGLAHSDDLVHWTKHPGNPVLEADPRWYEMLDLDVWFDQAWRDPYVVADPSSGVFHTFLTARSNSGPPEGRGVIGHATSPDLVTWSVGPPIRGPEGFGYMEIPQALSIGGKWHLLFSAPGWAQSTRPPPHCTGTFHVISERLEGPYREALPIVCDERETLYGGKLVLTPAQPMFIAFQYRDRTAGFVGELTDPMPVPPPADAPIALVESYSGGES